MNMEVDKSLIRRWAAIYESDERLRDGDVSFLDEDVRFSLV